MKQESVSDAIMDGKAASAATTTTANASSQSQKPKGPRGENVGRWSKHEHNIFLKGLEEHGRDWRKVAQMVQTRTVVQTRTHAQKYFQKLGKVSDKGSKGSQATRTGTQKKSASAKKGEKKQTRPRKGSAASTALLARTSAGAEGKHESESGLYSRNAAHE